jgi:hypothetical protein
MTKKLQLQVQPPDVGEDRLGNSLPKMSAVIPANRPTGVNHHMNLGDSGPRRHGPTGLLPIKK